MPKKWCWRRLESPSDIKEIKQVNSKGNQPWIFTGRLMLKLKLQFFGHMMWRADSLEKTLMLGKNEGRRKMGQQSMRWLDGIIDSMEMNSGSWWWTGKPVVLQSMGSQRVGHDWATEQQWIFNVIFRKITLNIFYILDKHLINCIPEK